MTRETKIGLLVGLAFIIVIGILLSDHFRGSMEPPQASLSGGADNARIAYVSPGTANTPVKVTTPDDAPPHDPVPTNTELNPPVLPVIPSATNSNPPQQPAAPQQNTQQQLTQQTTPPTVNGADPPAAQDPLATEARRQGEEIVPVNPNGSQTETTPTAPSTPGLPPYKAQSGDTLSRLAGRFLGANNRGNRQAIIDANPSLQDDPDTIILGKTYMIPVVTTAANTPSIPTTPAPKPDAPSTDAAYTYTVVSGDTLWGIANDELGDPSAVDAIKDLNISILKGENHDVVRPGMKLRLPGKPVASAN